MKGILKKILFLSIGVLVLGTTSVNASEYEDNLIKKIAPDGRNAIVKMINPTTADDNEFVMTAALTKMIDDSDYFAYAMCTGEAHENCSIQIFKGTEEGASLIGEYDINVTYENPDETTTNFVNNYINNYAELNYDDPSTYYMLEDLSLINYYNTSTKSELWNLGAPARAMKFSKKIIDLTKGGNISFYLDIRAGIQDESLMFESAFGGLTTFYNGYAFTAKTQGIYFKRVIYIPESTEETAEAFAIAAQKRINEYLGKDSVTVTYGGLISSLEEYSTDEIVVPVNTTDGNYYNVTIQGKTYKFYIMKGSSEKLAAPSYLSTELNSNISVKSDDSRVPLDTSLTVEYVENDEIKKALGTDNYYAYDIKLHSDASNSDITKLDNGKFLVSIPVQEKYNGKKLTVYYINSLGEKEEHKVTVENGKALFETNHFSTYILTEASEIENPNTFDNILLYFGGITISLIGIISASLYLKKKKFN